MVNQCVTVKSILLHKKAIINSFKMKNLKRIVYFLFNRKKVELKCILSD